MHRSGTSLVSRVLEDLGLFLGTRKDANNEAWLFLGLNEWILAQAGGAWDAPEVMRFLLRDEVASVAAAALRHQLGTPRLARFLGWGRYLRYRRLDRLDFAWGWKDPRTTVTLPLWLEVFPDARAVYVTRNGVDVAGSLEARTRAQLAESRTWLQRARPWSRLAKSQQRRLADSVRFLDLDEGYRLWAEYCQQAECSAALLPHDRWLEVRFEDFVAEPVAQLQRLCAFAGLAAGNSDLERAAAQIKRSRANAWDQDPRLRAFHDRVRRSDWMLRLGY
jgi:hypothetical protein